MAPTMQRMPAIRPAADDHGVALEPFSRSARSRSAYGLVSTNSSGSVEWTVAEQLLPPAVVEELREAGARRDAVVVAAARADEQVPLELLAVEDLAAPLALDPQPLGDAARAACRRSRCGGTRPWARSLSPEKCPLRRDRRVLSGAWHGSAVLSETGGGRRRRGCRRGSAASRRSTPKTSRKTVSGGARPACRRRGVGRRGGRRISSATRSARFQSWTTSSDADALGEELAQRSPTSSS